MGQKLRSKHRHRACAEQDTISVRRLNSIASTTVKWEEGEGGGGGGKVVRARTAFHAISGLASQLCINRGWQALHSSLLDLHTRPDVCLAEMPSGCAPSKGLLPFAVAGARHTPEGRAGRLLPAAGRSPAHRLPAQSDALSFSVSSSQSL